MGEDKGRYNNDKLEYMKYLKIRWIAVLLVAVGTSFFFGFKSGDNRSFQVAKNLDIFNSIVKELDMFYVDTIDPNKTIRTGIESMLYSLDPYTQYFPEDDQSELEQMLKNTYGGIGSIITWNTKLKRSMIAEPYEHMPAATVGLKAGDILMEIAGNDLASYCAHYAANGAAEGRNATTLISAGEGAQAAIVRGSCTTKFDPRASRATNIAVAASRINGVVIQPGEEFSFNRTILPRTAANGYVEAPIYVSGKHSTGTGGGICQVSSTMYSAMLNGGIPATERHPHSLPVPYLPEGRDATIAGNYYDLRFVNIYNTPLQISAVADLRTGTVSVTLIQQ